PQNDSRTEASFSVDFSDFPAAPMPSTAPLRASLVASVQGALSSMAALAPALPGPSLSLAAGFLIVVALVRLRRSRVAYVVIVLYVIVAMETTPLLQARAAQVLAASVAAQNQRQQQAQQDAQQQAQAQQQIQQANEWNPQRSPLAAAAAESAILSQ